MSARLKLKFHYRNQYTPPDARNVIKSDIHIAKGTLAVNVIEETLDVHFKGKKWHFVLDDSKY